MRRDTHWLVPLTSALAIHAGLIALAAHGDSPMTTDSWNYADVAHQIAAGRGISTRILPLGWDSPSLPPFTRQPPGYPILIACVARAGLTTEAAARAIALAAAFTSLALFFLVARRAGDEIATGATLALAASYPVAEVTSHALSEPLLLAVLFGALLASIPLIERPARGRHALARAFLAGSLAGVLPAIRYSGIAGLAVLALLVAAPLIRAGKGERARITTQTAAWCVGVLCTIFPLVAHLAAGGASFGELTPARQGFLANLVWCVTNAGADLALPISSIGRHAAWAAPLGVVVLAAGLWAQARRLARSPRDDRALSGSAEVTGFRGDAIVGFFAAVYPLAHFATLAAVRSHVHLNSWPARHLLPAYPFVILSVTIFVMFLLHRGAAILRAVAWILTASYLTVNAVEGFRDAHTATTSIDLGAVPEWILARTNPGDTIVANEAEVLVAAIPDRRIVALIRWPYASRNLEPADLPRLREQLGARWVVFLSARAGLVFAGGYGSFVRRVVENAGGAGLRFHAEIPGGLVFEITPGAME